MSGADPVADAGSRPAARGLIVLGDSHVRSYAASRYLSRALFIGNGKEINLIRASGLISYLLRVGVLRLCGALRRDQRVALVFGEPDVRWAVARSWTAADRASRPPAAIARTLRRSARRFAALLALLSLIGVQLRLIIGAGTPNPAPHRACEQMNAALLAVAQRRSLAFFDPLSVVAASTEPFEFVGPSVFAPDKEDKTHLSDRISAPFDSFVAQLGVEDIANRANVSEDYWFFSIIYFEAFRSHRAIYKQPLRKILDLLQRV